MSHFISIRTQITEREFLVQSIQELGYRVNENFDYVLGDKGKEQVEIVMETGCESKIGFRQTDASAIGGRTPTYEVVADWYNVELGSEIERNEFISKLKQKYSYLLVKDQAAEQNLIIEEEIDEDGEIILLLSERG